MRRPGVRIPSRPPSFKRPRACQTVLPRHARTKFTTGSLPVPRHPPGATLPKRRLIGKHYRFTRLSGACSRSLLSLCPRTAFNTTVNGATFSGLTYRFTNKFLPIFRHVIRRQIRRRNLRPSLKRKQFHRHARAERPSTIHLHRRQFTKRPKVKHLFSIATPPRFCSASA